MGWLFANLFLVSIAIVGAGYFWLFGSLARFFASSVEVERVLVAAGAVAALVATFFTMKRLHEFLETRIR